MSSTASAHDNLKGSLSYSWSAQASWKEAVIPGFGYKNIQEYRLSRGNDGVSQSSTQRDLFGPEMGIAACLSQKKPFEHYLLKLAVAGTPMAPNKLGDFWAPDGHLFNELISMIADAYNSKTDTAQLNVSGLFFIQGESDTLDENWANTYQKNLENFIRQLRSRILKMGCTTNSNFPVIIAKVQDNSIWGKNTYTVRTAQENVYRNEPNVRLVYTDDLKDPSAFKMNGVNHMVVGGVHFDEYAQSILGARMCEALLFPSPKVLFLVGRKNNQSSKSFEYNNLKNNTLEDFLKNITSH